MKSAVEKWLPVWRPREDAALRLFPLPYAGGDATIYGPWLKELPPDIELCLVQLPGRGRRLSEPMYTELEPLVGALADALAPALDLPFALFGHSLGAVVCFELARELRRRGGPLPSHLLVSGRPAPQLPGRYEPLHDLPDGEFLQRLHDRYGYAAPARDEQIDELVELMLPTIRSDVRISDRYACRAEAPLDCPITAFGGLEDPTVLRDELAGWQAQTRGRFEIRMLPGGHFYLESQHRFLVRFIVDCLRDPTP
jgi:medium-chain acyl-[acyl-carrier-protein] hydrolase